jgi:hypothetical protein
MRGTLASPPAGPAASRRRRVEVAKIGQVLRGEPFAILHQRESDYAIATGTRRR